MLLYGSATSWQNSLIGQKTLGALVSVKMHQKYQEETLLLGLNDITANKH